MSCQVKRVYYWYIYYNFTNHRHIQQLGFQPHPWSTFLRNPYSYGFLLGLITSQASENSDASYCTRCMRSGTQCQVHLVSCSEVGGCEKPCFFLYFLMVVMSIYQIRSYKTINVLFRPAPTPTHDHCNYGRLSSNLCRPSQPQPRV